MISKKLHSDFKFGFEFEGFAKIEKFMGDVHDYDYNIDSWDFLSCNSLYDRDMNNFYDNVNSFINNCFGSNKGRTHYDGSVKNYHNGYQSFEYSSPVFTFTPKNIQKIKNFFDNMEKNGFGINETCGFHTHISFPQMSEKDAIWIISQIAINEDKSNEFCYLKNGDTNIDFYSDRYASKKFLESIRSYINDKKYDMLPTVINGEKYKVLRIHPQGTIEWRGPRNFLNIKDGINLYIKKMTKIINILSSSLNEKEINGISKEEFFDMISHKEIYYDGWNIPYNCKIAKRNNLTGLVECFGKHTKHYHVDYISEKIANSIIKNPNKIFNKDYLPFFDKILNKLKYMKELSTVMNFVCKNNSSKKFDYDVKIKIIRTMPSYINILNKEEFKYLDDFDIFNWLDSIHISNEYDETISENIKYILSNIDKNILLNSAITLLSNASWTIKPIMDLISNGVFKNIDIEEIYKRYCKSYFVASKHNCNNTFVYKPEELHNELKTLMKRGLIVDITNKNTFNEEYQDISTNDFSSFFILDSFEKIMKDMQQMSVQPFFELSSDVIQPNYEEVEEIEVPRLGISSSQSTEIY